MRSTEVAARAGITYRQLDYWCRAGFIAARPRQIDGPGIERTWEPAEAERVAAIAAWVRLGVRPSRAARYVDAGHAAPTLAEAV